MMTRAQSPSPKVQRQILQWFFQNAGHLQSSSMAPSWAWRCIWASFGPQWSYMWVLVSIGFHWLSWCVWRHVLRNCDVLVCIDIVCIMACICMYYFWYLLHVLVTIGMCLRVICASIHTYWLVLACMEKWYVLYILVWICTINLYWPVLDVWYVLVCMVCSGLYL